MQIKSLSRLRSKLLRSQVEFMGDRNSVTHSNSSLKCGKKDGNENLLIISYRFLSC